MSWSKILISPEQSVLEAIKIIDGGGWQIAVVADKEGRLLGTVTDGDVRRSVLNGFSLEMPVEKIMQKDCLFADEAATREEILSLMRSRGIHQVPVLDSQRRIKRIEFLNDILWRKTDDHTVVLMAGGMGQRLKPLTNNCPKPLLKVGDKPILEWILEKFISQGFSRFRVSVNYMAEAIENYFGDGSKWGVDVGYLREDKKLGTAGALSLLEEKVEKPIIVMNGDLLTNVNFEHLLKYHESAEAAATMCVRQYNMQIPYGVVDLQDDEVIGIEEKPVHEYFVNGGIYVLNPEALELIPKDREFHMTELLASLKSKEMKVSPFPLREYWLDIGRENDFKLAQMEVEKVHN